LRSIAVGVDGDDRINIINLTLPPIGFTPLIQRSWKIKGNTKYFVEADFPVRFRQRPDLRRTTSGTFTAHFGVAF
jgi:hypothetical protein